MKLTGQMKICSVPKGTAGLLKSIPIYLHTGKSGVISIGINKLEAKRIGYIRSVDCIFKNNTLFANEINFLDGSEVTSLDNYFIIAKTMLVTNRNQSKSKKICDIHISKK